MTVKNRRKCWHCTNGSAFEKSILVRYSLLLHTIFFLVLHISWLFGEGTCLESIALRTAFTFCSLVTQKPTRNSKSKDHISCLKRRLFLWSDGNLNESILEGRTIQNHFKTRNHPSSIDSLSRSLAKLTRLCCSTIVVFCTWKWRCSVFRWYHTRFW